MKPAIVATGSKHLEFSLHENHPLPLVRAAGRHVECVSGLIWITAYDQRVDFFIGPGKTFEVPNDGLTLIEAIGSARIRVEQPQPLDRALFGLLAAGSAKAMKKLAGLAWMPQWMRLR